MQTLLQTILRSIPVLSAVPFVTAMALAQPAQHDVLADDVPLNVYLDALTQISPAARAGADAYRAAFERRCGRPLKSIELRRAIADGNGNPVLMAMMRAAFQRDTAALQRLTGTLSCVQGR